MTLAVVKNGMLRYNSTCERCGESFMITNTSGEAIKSTMSYDCSACGTEKSVFVHQLTTILIKDGRGVLV